MINMAIVKAWTEEPLEVIEAASWEQLFELIPKKYTENEGEYQVIAA